MSFTLWVTRSCNLSCSYCYANKLNKSMTKDTAVKSIRYIKEKISELKNELKSEKIKIIIHGGEPLLNFDIVKFIVNELNSDNSIKDKLRFYMTTNGTLMSCEIKNFIKENIKNSLSISLDGKKEDHDRYRKYKDEKGSFDRVCSTLKMMIESGVHVRVRMTFNSKTVFNIFKNYKFIYDFGARSIVFIPDCTDKRWDLEGIEAYYDNLKSVIEFLRENDKPMGKLFLRNLKDSCLKKRIKCTGGTKTFHIDYDGKIYPCSYSVGDDTYVIGNIFTGIDSEKINKLEKINIKINTVCNGCKIYNFCDSSICKIVNKNINGDFYTPSAVLCRINHMKIKILREFKVI